MSVVNGQIANETTFNASFMSRLAANTSTLSIISLLNTAVASGASVNNVQALLNKIIEGLGTTGETDTAVNYYGPTPNYVVNGQNRKQAIVSLDTSLKTVADRVTAVESGGASGVPESFLTARLNSQSILVDFDFIYDFNTVAGNVTVNNLIGV